MSTRAMAIGAACLGFVWLVGSGVKAAQGGNVRRPPTNERVAANRRLIQLEARRQGVPEEIALAFARVESGFDDAAKGDANWHKNAERFEAVVPKDHPLREQRELWRSYGLFQLLAPYFVEGHEDPRVLLDPATNAERGVRFIYGLLRQYHTSDAARLAYTGARLASDATKKRILDNFHRALELERKELGNA